MAPSTVVIAPEKRLHIASFQKHYSPKMCAWRTFPISHSFCGHFNKHGSRGSLSGETSAAAPQNFRQYPMQIVPQARKGKLISLPPSPLVVTVYGQGKLGFSHFRRQEESLEIPLLLLLLLSPSRLRQSSLQNRALESRESFHKVSLAPKRRRNSVSAQQSLSRNGAEKGERSISLSAPPAADKEHRKTPKKQKHLDSILTPRGEGKERPKQ